MTDEVKELREQLNELEVKLDEKLDYEDFEEGLGKEGLLDIRDAMSLVIKQLMYIIDILGDKMPTINVHDYKLLESYKKR
tara:strand:+ start:16388 stop:16627 length:240 start_codon:yes stop_codon:yes gene_type:complete